MSLKFRAWDGKRMLYDIGIHPSISMVHEGYERDQPGYITISPLMTSYTIMQFTGIKDIRKEEIYAGDVCECHIIDGNDRIINIFKVVWSDDFASFGFAELDSDHLIFFMDTINEIHIIGNIYEGLLLFN